MSVAGLYGRQASKAIAEAAAAGKGLTPAGTPGKTVTFPLNGASAIVVHATYNNLPYSAIIPVAWMTETPRTWAIALSTTYLGITVSAVDGVCTVSHSSYNLTCYTLGAVGAGGGGGGESHTHPNLSILNGITAEQIAAWDAFAEHPSDTVAHITAAERAAWNAAVTELAGLNAAIGSGTV